MSVLTPEEKEKIQRGMQEDLEKVLSKWKKALVLAEGTGKSSNVEQTTEQRQVNIFVSTAQQMGLTLREDLSYEEAVKMMQTSFDNLDKEEEKNFFNTFMNQGGEGVLETLQTMVDCFNSLPEQQKDICLKEMFYRIMLSVNYREYLLIQSQLLPFLIDTLKQQSQQSNYSNYGVSDREFALASQQNQAEITKANLEALSRAREIDAQLIANIFRS